MNKLRKWGFTIAAAAGTIAPYTSVIKPVVKVVADDLGTHKTIGQIVLSAAIAGLVAYQAFKADPRKSAAASDPSDSAQ